MLDVARRADLLDVVALSGLRFAPVGGLPAAAGARRMSPLGGLIGALALPIGQHRLFVAGCGRTIRAAVHVLASGDPRRWDVVGTAVTADGLETLAALLDYVGIEAAVAGIARVLARPTEDDPRAPSFLAAGFRPYAQEVLFARVPAPCPSAADGFSVRPYDAADSWSIARLASAGVPANIRSLEPLTPQEFFEPFAQGIGLVLEDGGEVVAAVAALPSRARAESVIRLVVRPGAVTAGEAALLTLLDRLHDRGVARAWLPVREYLSDALTAARLAEFEEQALRRAMAKHTAALVRQPLFARLREAPAALSTVHPTRLAPVGGPGQQCRLRDPRARRRIYPAPST